MTKPTNETDSQDFLSNKKESIGLVIYQISQLDKSMTQLTERLDVIVNRLELRLQALELWKAGFNQKIATQEQIDALREDYKGMRNFLMAILSVVVLTIVGAVLKLVLKI